MADIEQELQEVEQERSRLSTAKANLKTAITGKGVTVPDSAKLDEYSSFVNEIQQGGSGGSMEIYKCASVDSVNNTWSGYFYNTENKQFSDTLTEGLEYKMAAPIVGKVYNADATMLIDLYAPEGLVFYAPFNTTKSTDEMGGTMSGNIQTTEFKGVTCLNLNGYGVTVTSSKIPVGNDPRTFSFMVHETQPPNSNTWPFIVEFGPHAKRFVANTDYNKQPSVVSVVAMGSTDGIEAPTPITTNFVHVAVSYDGTNMALFENGIFIGETPSTAPLELDGTFVIGKNLTETTYFYGNIAEVKVWNRALSSEEIKSEADRCLAMVTE